MTAGITLTSTTTFLALVAALVAVEGAALPAPLRWRPCSLQTEASAGQASADQAAGGVHADLYARLPLEHVHRQRRRLEEEAAGNSTTNATNPNKAYRAECAFLQAPLLQPTHNSSLFPPEAFEEADGVTVEVFMKRLVRNDPPAGTQAEDPTPRKAMWFLQGGPGGSSAGTIETFMEWGAVELLDEGFDFYTMDHRGVARSTRLSCTAAQAEETGSPGGEAVTEEEMEDCVSAMNERFSTFSYNHAFSSTAAGADLYDAIHATKAQEGYDDVYVYGVSYGTRWVQRYLNVAAEKDEEHLVRPQAAGVVLDGIVGPSSSFKDFDKNHDIVGKDFLKLCDQEPECAAKLGGDAVAFARSVVDGPGCGKLAGIDLKKIMTGLLQHGGGIRGFIPAFLYRADRCTKEDQLMLALMGLVPQMLSGEQPCETAAPARLAHFYSSTPMLYNTILRSELCEGCNETTKDEFLAIENASIFAGSTWTSYYNESSIRYVPAYEPKEWEVAPATTGSRVLFLTGSLDPQTAPHWATEVVENTVAPWKREIAFANSAHAAAAASAVTAPATWQKNEAMPLPCGFQALVLFARGELSEEGGLECLRELEPVGFHGLGDLNTHLLMLETNDVFDGKVKLDGMMGDSTSTATTEDKEQKLFNVWMIVLGALGATVLVGLALSLMVRACRTKGSGSLERARSHRLEEPNAKASCDIV